MTRITCERVTNVLLLASLLGVCCCFGALANGVPAGITLPPGLDGSTALFTSPSFGASPNSDSAAVTANDLVALVAPSVGLGAAGDEADATADSKSSGQKWLSSAAYVATAAGLAVGLAPAFSGSGGGGGSGTLSPDTRQGDGEPVPEPSTLVLAAFACSSALGVLRRKKIS